MHESDFRSVGTDPWSTRGTDVRDLGRDERV